MSRVFYQMFQLCKQTGKDYFTFEGEKISIAGKTLEQFTKEFNEERQPHMILTQLEVAFKLINIRLQVDAITVVKLGEDNLEYLISDNPVIASNPRATRFAPFDPTNLLYLPLDPKHMLILIPEKQKDLKIGYLDELQLDLWQLWKNQLLTINKWKIPSALFWVQKED